MFKKTCNRCKKKIDKKFDFCPYCGSSQTSLYEDSDYGLLGKNDFLNENFANDKNFENFLNNASLDKIFNAALKISEKIIEKHIRDFNPETKPKLSTDSPNLDIKFFVNGKRIFPQNPNKEKVKRTNNFNKLSKEKEEKLATLPRKEPVSKMKRFSEKIIYEFEVPGVKNINDILVNELENSIEIKAISKDKVYSKTINVKLPIIKYSLKNENLILELKAK